jgi:hypothetical protein
MLPSNSGVAETEIAELFLAGQRRLFARNKQTRSLPVHHSTMVGELLDLSLFALSNMLMLIVRLRKYRQECPSCGR